MVRAILLLLVVFLIPFSGAAAQSGGDLLAFANPSGQLIVTSGDGNYRWIVTNPGEPLASGLGFNWSPDGSRLFFGVDVGGTVSLRVGDPNAQTWSEIGSVSSSATGGDWTANASAVFIADQTSLYLFGANGSGISAQVDLGQQVRAISPTLNNRPYLAIEHSLAPDGSSALVQTGRGEYVLVSFNGSVGSTGITNDPNARSSGIWSESAPTVAFWGYVGNSALAAAYAPSGTAAVADSGRAAPVTPLTWIPDSTTLIFRDASAYIRAADLGCLPSCGGEVFTSGSDVLPSSATDVQADNSFLYYRDGSMINAVPLNCVSNGSCLNSIRTLVSDADGVSGFDASSGWLAYTSSSGLVTVVDVNNCLNSGACASVINAPYGRAGVISRTGSYVSVDAGGLLALINLNSGAQFDVGQGIALDRVRWN